MSYGPKGGTLANKGNSALDDTKARWVVIYFLACVRGVFQMTRISMGPLVVFMTKDFGFDLEEKGAIFSAFAAGYMFTQVPGGLLADRIGSTLLLFLGIITSGIALLILPIAAEGGVSVLWWTLFLMGIMQGPCHPATVVMTSRWTTDSLRSYASAVQQASSNAGSLVALGLTTVLSGHIGWRGTSMVYGAVVVVFSFIWKFTTTDTPPEEADDVITKAISTANVEPKKQTSAAVAEAADARSSYRKFCRALRLLTSTPVLAIFAAHTVYNSVRYFLMSWMPTYYAEVLEVSPNSAGVQMMIPELCGMCAGVFGADMAKSLQDRGAVTPRGLRRLFSLVAFLGGFVGLVVIAFVTPQQTHASLVVTFWLSVLHGSSTLQGLGYHANYMDVSVHHAGLVVGVGNTVATLGSFVSPVFASWVLPAAGSPVGIVIAGWQRLFMAMAFLNLVGIAAFIPFCSADPVDCSEEFSSERAEVAALQKKQD